MPTEFEKEVKEKLEDDGWTVYASGWPDFLCIRGSEVKAVEVKGPNDKFRGHQRTVLGVLARFMEVRTARPGDGTLGDMLQVVDADNREEMYAKASNRRRSTVAVEQAEPSPTS
jgi:hypothetical protein